MSVNSLSNFGIPGLAGERSAVLQPIMANRFRVLFYNFGNNGEIAPYDLTRQVRSITRPGMAFELQTIYAYVSTVYIVSRAEWKECTIRFLDDITNQVQSRIQQQVSKQFNFADQTMARAGENYKFEMDLDVLAGGATAGSSTNDPNIIQKWVFSGCQITDTDQGEMTQGTAEGLEIGITVRFDNCIPFSGTGIQLGTFSHSPEIAAQLGLLSTGAGTGAGFNINIAGQTAVVQ